MRSARSCNAGGPSRLELCSNVLYGDRKETEELMLNGELLAGRRMVCCILEASTYLLHYHSYYLVLWSHLFIHLLFILS